MPKQPVNLNPSLQTNYKFQLDRCPDSTFFCQSANIPGVNLGTIKINGPHASLPLAGGPLKYNNLVINFLVNENLSNYNELYQWMSDISGAVDGFGQFKTNIADLKKTDYSPATFTLLSSKKNPLMVVKYSFVVPTSLSDLRFNNTSTTTTGLTAEATFVIGNYVIESA